jgi:type II secretory pathway predicted ATPase ExeA
MSYAHRFGFTHLPFHRDLDSTQLFHVDELDELHARLRFLVEHRALGVLTGEPGCGKSTALRRLRDDLHPEQVRILYISDTLGTPRELCASIALELGIEPCQSRVRMLRDIQHEIQRLAEERRLDVLLLIDEAQGLRNDVLVLLPQLRNFQWDRRPPLSILLAGQPGLRQKLRLAHLEPLDQRVTLRYHLRGLSREQTEAYLLHRLRLAGVDRPLFAADALEALHTATAGVMRRIDGLAHQAMALAATQGEKAINAEHVRQAAQEQRG